MRDINYALRNERYSTTEYDLQKLVGKRFLGIDYRTSEDRRYKDVQAYEVTLKWEGFVMVFGVVDRRSIPFGLKRFIDCKLEDWYAMPNHACTILDLYFEDAEKVIYLNTWGGIKWESATADNFPGLREVALKARNEWYLNTKYDLTRLIGKKFLGISYKKCEGALWEYDKNYEVSLEWEGDAMGFISPDSPQNFNAIGTFIDYKLKDWEILPIDAREVITLYFENTEETVTVTTCAGHYGIEWESSADGSG
ncbi:MAG: hypothetical protein FWF18_02715 [Dehalococcoidia bacterium]|nr:hypothetical protein [Dehalococcoidia bacterium]